MKRYRGIFVVVLLVGLALGTEVWLNRRAVPPAYVTNFVGFTRWQTPERVEVIQNGGNDYLFAMTSGGGFLLKSGPPGYVFDRSGKLVDWSTDIGDDPRFREKWIPRRFGTEQNLSTDEAHQWIESDNSAGGSLVTIPARSSR